MGYGAGAGARAMRACAIAVAILMLPVVSAPAAPPLVTESGVNRGVVELETLGTDVSVRIGEDLAVITDDGATRRLFDLLGITVTFTNDDQRTALEKLRRGDIAAVAFVSGKPTPLFRELDDKDGLHFLAIPLSSAITEAFVPTRLTKDDYPGLVASDQPVSTVAVGTVLVAANLAVDSPRYRNIANFVNAFFTGFQSLTEPGHHPKWREVNLYADFPGWVRFPPADQWLQRNAPSPSEPPQDLKAAFSKFIEDRQKAAGGAVLTDQQKDDLYQQFQRWQAGRTH